MPFIFIERHFYGVRGGGCSGAVERSGLRPASIRFCLSRVFHHGRNYRSHIMFVRADRDNGGGGGGGG